VHIQNQKKHFEPDDFNAFTDRRKDQAERALEITMKVMAARYPRPEHARGHVADFILPWDEHYA